MLLNKNVELYEEYANLITVVAVRDAFHTMIGAASTLLKFNCYPTHKGEVPDFQYHTLDDQYPFAFIINQKSLLFYLRPPAVESKIFNLEDLKDSFDEVNKNNKGEWTIRINNPDDAININKKMLLSW